MNEHQIEDLARVLSARLWRGVVLPGLGLQLALLGAVCLLASPLTSLSCWAQDDGAAALRAVNPDPGPPPAPPLDTKADTKADSKADNQAEPIAAKTIGPAVESAVEPAPASTAVAVDDSAIAEPKAAPAAVAEVTADSEINTPEVETIQVESAQSQSAQSQSPTQQPDTVRELSVEPALESKPLLPADRPRWVGAAPDLSTSVHRLFVGGSIMSTAAQAQASIDESMIEAVKSYLSQNLDMGGDAYKLPVTANFIHRNLLDPSSNYLAELTTSQGPMYQQWVVLRITPEHRENFAVELKQVQQRERMSLLGVGVLGLLTLTGIANFAFQRRRRRYPTTLPPATMALVPGHDQPIYVADLPGLQQPQVAIVKPTKKRAIFPMVLLIVVGVGAMLALLTASIKVKRERSTATAIEVDNQLRDEVRDFVKNKEYRASVTIHGNNIEIVRRQSDDRAAGGDSADDDRASGDSAGDVHAGDDRRRARNRDDGIDNNMDKRK
ncbi:MAG: hypothetical protein IT423_20090 [Pirellulaceae bacterium]|nr:hypothetical protein [Pirellulaceae bacterium]